MRRILILFPFLFLFPAIVFGQSFHVNQPGTGRVRLGVSGRLSNSYFDSNKDKIKIRTNGLYISYLSGEYAISKRLDVFIDFPYLVTTTINNIKYRQSGNVDEGDALSSLGDFGLGTKLRIPVGTSFTVAPYLMLSFPFGKKQDVGTETDLQTGDGEFNQILGVEVRYKIEKRNIELLTFGAINNRTEHYSDEIRFGAQAGYSWKKINLKISLDVIESLFNDTAPVSLNSIFSNHLEVVSPGVTTAYNIRNNFWVYGSYSFVAYGRNILDAPAIGLGVEYRFRRNESLKETRR
jgi:protein XagA